MAAASVWVLLGNIVRIVTVASVDARLHVDLGSGWRHETLGFIVLFIVLALVASTDRLFQFFDELASWVRRRVKRRWEKRFRRSNSVRRRNSPSTTTALTDAAPQPASPEPVGDPADEAVAHTTQTKLPLWHGTFLGSRKAVYGLGLLGVIVLVLNGSGFSYAAPAIERRFSSLKAEDMPAQVGAYRRESFAANRQGPRYGRGEFFRDWVYRAPDALVQVAVSYPFIGWHELTECYQAEGWMIASRRVEPEVQGNAIVVALSKPLEKSAVLWFSFDDGTGAPVPPSRYGGWRANLRERLTLGWWRSALFGRQSDDSKTSYQVQLIVQSDHPLTADELRDARLLFERAREKLRSTVHPGNAP
jgi:hypothetical protein